MLPACNNPTDYALVSHTYFIPTDIHALTLQHSRLALLLIFSSTTFLHQSIHINHFALLLHASSQRLPMNLTSDPGRFPPTKGLEGSWERSRWFHLNLQLRKLNAGFVFHPTHLPPTKTLPSSSLLSQSSGAHMMYTAILLYTDENQENSGWQKIFIALHQVIYTYLAYPFPNSPFLFWNYEEGASLPGHSTAFHSHLSFNSHILEWSLKFS